MASSTQQDIDAVVSFTDTMAPNEFVDYALRLEDLGYDALWLPDLFGREIFVLAGHILANTTRLRVATGIANVYARDPMSAGQAARTLGELHDGRFILGLGVSHPQVAEMRGQEWVPPVKKLSAYLAGIAAAPVRSPKPSRVAPIYIAAHGPKLLALAAKSADGANTYLMPPPHTKQAREILGAKTLNVVLPCCLCEDADHARTTARKGLTMYLGLPAYHRQWQRFGLDEMDYADGGSDRLVDTLVAWGDEDAIRARVAEHVAAGADRVKVISYNPEQRDAAPHWKLLETLAPGTA
jgi:probable F420-dependent oxidoreductase